MNLLFRIMMPWFAGAGSLFLIICPASLVHIPNRAAFTVALRI
jgi:hypothetical protein